MKKKQKNEANASVNPKKKEEESGQITFVYSKLGKQTPTPLSGVYGGVNPHAEIVAHLFFEYQGIPDWEVREIAKSGEVGNVVEKADSSFVREVFSTLVMDSGTARHIAKWLQDRADQVDNLKKEIREHKQTEGK
jgi:hypothetical protein